MQKTIWSGYQVDLGQIFGLCDFFQSNVMCFHSTGLYNNTSKEVHQMHNYLYYKNMALYFIVASQYFYTNVSPYHIEQRFKIETSSNRHLKC